MDSGPCVLPQWTPLFPLPEIVLFPNQVLHLHIFEPRYQVMTTEALAGPRLIAMALLRTGYEELYYTHRAPIEATVGVGRILGAVPLGDGRFNILLRGVMRAQVIEECGSRPFRLARLLPLPAPCLSKQRCTELREMLRNATEEAAGHDCELVSQWRQMFEACLPVAEIVDLISGSLPAPADVRQTLLAETDVAQRTLLLIEHLQTISAVTRQRCRAGQAGEWTAN